MNRNNALKKLVLAALFVALDLLFTRVFCIYLMGGAERVSLQTLASAVCGWALGPWWGAAAGGIGSMLADLLLGYGHYAPGTLVIKGLMALVGALVFKAFGKSSVGALVSCVISEIIMVAGYFGYAALLLGKGIGAAASIPGNLVQAAMGLVIGLVLFFLLKRSKVLDKLALQ